MVYHVSRVYPLNSGMADTLPSGNAIHVCQRDTIIIAFFCVFVKGKNAFFKQQFGLINRGGHSS